MDRCRCAEYAEACKKIRFFTLGTYHPDFVDKFDRTGFAVGWIRNRVSNVDRRMIKPVSRKILKTEELYENALPKEARKIEQMWCPFMSKIEIGTPLDKDIV